MISATPNSCSASWRWRSIESRQHDQVVRRDELLRLLFATDDKDGVVGLEHGLRHRRQKLLSSVRMFLEADEHDAEAVD